MAYMLMVMEPRDQRPSRSPQEGEALYDRMVKWGQQLAARDLLVASESLRSDQHGVRVAIRGGKRLMTDGPFTESKEMVGGFYLLTCQTRDEAIALAAECPAAEWATIEVREVAPCFAG